MLADQFGDREAARHFLNAYDVSGRIIPEVSALLWHPGSTLELRMPYPELTYSRPKSWTTSRMRGRPLLPIWHYAYWVAEDPKLYKDRNGSEWQNPNGTHFDYRQEFVWGTEGDFDILPTMHMKKVRSMGEACLREAELGLKSVRRNKEQAEQAYHFMKAYRLLSRYWERKVAATVAALVYTHTRKAEDKAEAEKLADEVVASYVEAATSLHEKLDSAIKTIRGIPMCLDVGAESRQPSRLRAA